MGRQGEWKPNRPDWTWLQPLLELVFPARCLGCGCLGSVWCAQCNDALEPLRGPLCAVCGEPLPSRSVCRRCSPCSLAFPIRSFARYRGPLARALVRMKYRPSAEMAAVMGEWLGQVVRQAGWRSDLAVPVPLGRGRQRRRGYNQVALIASSLAGTLGIEFRPAALQRTRETPSQVGLDADARRRNVQSAFQARPQDVQDKSVCLVDDLMTTGATLAACAEALRLAGCRAVVGVTVGRA
jgi:ComF family protein